MHVLLLVVLVVSLVFGPALWIRRVMERYSRPEDRYEGTGADLARLLLDRAGLEHVRVEAASGGDHYDPTEQVVRLSPEHLEGRSLTAITVAAHEVGHALQDSLAYGPLRLRTRLVTLSRPIERFGAGVLVAAPVIAIVTRAPSVTGIMILGGLMSLGAATLVHLVTLPTELDASFNRALPLLRRERVLHASDEPHARRILKAAALTYVAASLMSLLNVARWWALVRR